MTGSDLSASTFDSHQDFSLSIALQGRVSTDDDLNVSAQIIDRRLRATDYDLAGLAPIVGVRGIAAVPETTPDAFGLFWTESPDEPGRKRVFLGNGRYYVDGLLVENHGTRPAWDPALEELNGTFGCPYVERLWFPGTELPGSEQHLVYLVAALRTVDALLEPDLIDPAFDIDTTVRRQVVWDVRTIKVPANNAFTAETPDDQIPDWSDLIAPSSGRLTTRTVTPPDTDDVCILPPTGGYRGLENQFYRVEIVKPGGLGTARFVVSRENASVRSLVIGMDGDHTAHVASVGRDDVLSFHKGDLAQIIDERTELSWIPEPQAAGAGGQFARVVDVRRDEGVIELDGTPLAGYAGLTTEQLLDARVRIVRWESSEKLFAEDGTDITATHLGADGTILVDATPIRLESGIVIEFSDVGGPGFHLGDSFSFTARYRTSEIEKLDAAPPHSLHRHYARLGLWLGEKSQFTDWRRHVPQTAGGTPPPDEDCGCCDIRVTPESHETGELTIQDAIEKADANGGGVVILCPGVYLIDRPIVMKGVQRVIVRGSGPATELRSAAEIFVLARCSGVRFEDFRTVTGTPSTHVVIGGASTGIHLLRVELIALEERGQEAPPGAVVAVNGVARLVTLERCTVQGVIGIGPWTGSVEGVESTTTHSLESFEVDGCLVSAVSTGVRLDASVLLAAEIVIHDSTVICTRGVGIQVVGAQLQDSTIRIEDNSVLAADDGIAVGGVASMIAGNDIRSIAEQEGRSQAAGVQVSDSRIRSREEVAMLEVGGSGGTVAVHDNRIDGFVFGVLASRRLLPIEVADNTILGSAFGVVVAAQVGVIAIRSNSVRTLVPAREFSAYGIVVVGGDSVHIDGNLVDGAESGAYGGDLDDEVVGSEEFVWPGISREVQTAGGIFVMGSREIGITSNRVRNLLPLQGEATSSIGIRAEGPFLSASIGDNSVHALADGQDAGPFGANARNWQALVIDDASGAPVTATAGWGSLSYVGVATAAAREEQNPFSRLVFAGESAWVVDAVYRDRELGVTDNLLTDVPAKDGGRPLVLIDLASPNREQGVGIVRFAGNGVRGSSGRTVFIRADYATVTANTVVRGELIAESLIAGVDVGNIAAAYGGNPALPLTQFDQLNVS